MANLFISYCRTHKSIVEEMTSDLDSVGHAVWVDKELTGGQSWWCKILQEIRECDFFLAAVSKSFNASEACEKELDYAFSLNKTIIPVKVFDDFSDSLLPARLGRLQIADYQYDSKLGLVSLINAISNASPSPELPHSLPAEPSLPISYLGLLAQQINQKKELFRDQQELIIYKLRKHFTQTGEAKPVLQSLDQFQKRNDLLSDIGSEINGLRTEILASKQEPESRNQQEDIIDTQPANFFKGVRSKEDLKSEISDIKDVTKADSSAIFIALLAAMIPIAGVVLYFVWRNDNPKKARMMLWGSSIGFALYLGYSGCSYDPYY